LSIFSHHLSIHNPEPIAEKQSVDALLFLRKTIIRNALVEFEERQSCPLVAIGQSDLKEVCARVLLAAARNVGSYQVDNPVSKQSPIAENDRNVKTPNASIPMCLCELVCSLLVSRDYEVRRFVLEHLSTNLPRFHVSPRDLGSPTPGTEGYENLQEEEMVRIISTLLEMAVETEQHLDCLAKVMLLAGWLPGWLVGWLAG